MIARHSILPARGSLLINTDLHGNLDDFDALEKRFLSLGDDAHWAILGDLVHGPDESSSTQQHPLYGYPDRSAQLIERVIAARRAHPGRVHVVLGNHDAGHVGFRHTAKFYDDEVVALEARLTDVQIDSMRALFHEAMLVIAAPCGVVMSHGSPGDAVTSLSLLAGEFPPRDEARMVAIGEVLWCYGQRGEVSERYLARASAELGISLRIVVHGHDRDESGWFVEGGNQVQPVLFGAPRSKKRALLLDLSARYEEPIDFREEIEIIRVHD